jgi:hypothetical protein
VAGPSPTPPVNHSNGLVLFGIAANAAKAVGAAARLSPSTRTAQRWTPELVANSQTAIRSRSRSSIETSRSNIWNITRTRSRADMPA